MAGLCPLLPGEMGTLVAALIGITRPNYFKNLPTGWKSRVATLEQELIETPEGGVATIMSASSFNVYDNGGPGQ